MQINNFAQLRTHAQSREPKRVAIAAADDDVALSALAAAISLRLATPILVGNIENIQSKIRQIDLEKSFAAARFVEAADAHTAARRAVEMARNGEADIILKGHLRTDELLHAVLDKTSGLRTGRLLSDVLLYEDRLGDQPRLVAVTDGGINVLPTLEQKIAIIQNAVQVLQALGRSRPKVALMSASEAVTPVLPSTLDAQQITAMAQKTPFADCEVFGPLALDNALLVAAARAKGITSPVAGQADIMVVPNIEAGNILGKAVKYLGSAPCGHVIMGARVPVLIPSRVESADDKLNAIAMGVLSHG